jgi:site-specific recombinase XerD
MNDIIVRPIQEENPLISAAKKGLFSELTDLSVLMYEKAIDDFIAYALGEGGAAFGNSMAVAFASYLKHLTDEGYKPSSVNAKRAQIRRFFQWGVTVGWVDHQTLQEVNQVKAPKQLGSKHGNWIDQGTMQKMLNSIDTSTVIGRRDKALLALLFGCGLRRSEVVDLTWGHLQRIGNSWAIVNLLRKHHRVQALIAVPNWVMKAIESYRLRGADNEHIILSYNRWGQPNTGITGDGIRCVVKGYSERLGLGSFTPHDARRSFARESKKTGVPLSQLSITLGHSSVAITEHYVNEIYDLDLNVATFELEI